MNGAARWVERADRVLHGTDLVFRAATVAILAVMLAINAVNILWRGLFDQSLNAVWPLTLLLFVWMSYLGFFVIYRENRDIRVDFIINRLGAVGQTGGRLLVDILVIGLMILIVLEFPRIVSSQTGEIQLLPIQRYWLSVPLFLSCVLVAVHFLLDLARLALGMEPPQRPARNELDIPGA